MTVGGILGLNAVELPWVEMGISASLIVLGLVLAINLPLTVILAAALTGFFAIFHGHAHGAEMPEDASGLQYALGFLLATAILHAGGIGLGLVLPRLLMARAAKISQACGVVMALTGTALITGIL